MNKWELVDSLKLVLSAIYYRKSKDYWSNFNNEKEQPGKRVAGALAQHISRPGSWHPVLKGLRGSSIQLVWFFNFIFKV